MIKLSIKDSRSGKELDFESTNNFSAKENEGLINKLTSYMNGDPFVDKQQKTETRSTVAKVDKAKQSLEKENKLAVLSTEKEEKSRPKSINLLNSERTLNTTIKERLVDAFGNEIEHDVTDYKPGSSINSSEERPKWKTIFSCPECGENDDKLVPVGFRFTVCDACGTEVHVQPANISKGWGHEDDEGFMYHAMNFYYPRNEISKEL